MNSITSIVSLFAFVCTRHAVGEYVLPETALQDVAPQLIWSVSRNDMVSVVESADKIVFRFEWIGSLFIDRDMGMLFSVCDKPHTAHEYRCSDPEAVSFDAYQVALVHERQSTLSVDVIVVGLDMDGQPIVSTGVHQLHYNDRSPRYPLYQRPVSVSLSELQIRHLVFNGALLVVMFCSCYLLMLSCCLRAKYKKSRAYRMVRPEKQIAEKVTCQVTTNSEVEGDETTGIFVDTV
eukprot:703713_1